MNRLDSELPAGTYTVSEFAWEMKGLLADAYPSVWVVGEVQRLNPHRNGHLYFEMIEKGRGDRIVGKLDCVLWADERAATEAALREAGVELEEGAVLRCAGRPDVWPNAGRLQFKVDEVDPLFSLGALERRRRETLRALEAEGLLERNKGLPLARVPLDVGLVTSEGSAAYHDFLDTLRSSGLGFRVNLAHARVQGAQAETEVARAFDLLGALARGGRRLDAIVLIRGGGSRSDLAAFDSRRVARSVARSGAPVITGIGHQIDRSIADVVAHTSCKTPTEAAEFLVGRVEDAAYRLEEAQDRLLGQSTMLLRAARTRLDAAVPRVAPPARALLRGSASDCRVVERQLRQAVRQILGAAARTLTEAERTLGRRAVVPLVRASSRLDAAADRLPGPSRRLLTAQAHACSSVATQASRAAERLLRAAKQQQAVVRAAVLRDPRRSLRLAADRVAAHARLRDQLAPEGVLARGFSLTFTAEGGLVRGPGDVSEGAELRTRVRDGVIGSRVVEIGDARLADAEADESNRGGR